MAEEVKKVEKTVSRYECSMCGLDGGPDPGCELCHGNKRFLQERNFTLSEERQGLNPERGKDRYGPTGDVNPRIVVVPGGYNPAQGLQNQSNQEKN